MAYKKKWDSFQTFFCELVSLLMSSTSKAFFFEQKRTIIIINRTKLILLRQSIQQSSSFKDKCPFGLILLKPTQLNNNMRSFQTMFDQLSALSVRNTTKTLYCLLIVSSLVAPMLSVRSLELDITISTTKRSQIVGFSKGQVTNYYNYQYYCRMELGQPGQKFDVILDTGSTILWVPSAKCSSCPDEKRKFDSTLSNSTAPLPLRDHIKYGKGQVTGNYVMDFVYFQGMKSFMSLLLVDQQKDTENSQADGIMGLSNLRSVKNVLDIAHHQGNLVSPLFAFELGNKQLKQKSYFLYNISQQDYPDAVYVNASTRDYWTMPVRDSSFGNLSFKVKNALVDSGTSLILLPEKMFRQMDIQVFSKYCMTTVFSTFLSKQGPNTKICKCPHQVQYPNLTILTNTLSFNITPEDYISGSYNRRNCILGIDRIANLSLDFMILGDIFFHGKTIIFDKPNNRMGFISSAKAITVYPNSSFVYYALDIIGVLGLIAAVLILMLRRKRGRSIQSLSERLNHPQTQLATVQ